jgi:hypothetical protein
MQLHGHGAVPPNGHVGHVGRATATCYAGA